MMAPKETTYVVREAFTDPEDRDSTYMIASTFTPSGRDVIHRWITGAMSSGRFDDGWTADDLIAWARVNLPEEFADMPEGQARVMLDLTVRGFKIERAIDLGKERGIGGDGATIMEEER